MAYKKTQEKWPEDQNNWLRRRKDWSDEMEENSFLLLQCIRNKNFNEAETLLDNGANPNFKDGIGQNAIDVDENGMNSLHVAVNYGCTPVLFNKILARIRNVNAVTSRHETALHLACKEGRIYASEVRYNLVISLMNHPNIDPNIQDVGKRTALHWAVIHQHIDVVKKLVSDYRVDCTIKDIYKLTPLQVLDDKFGWDGLETTHVPNKFRGSAYGPMADAEKRQAKRKKYALDTYEEENVPLWAAIKAKDYQSSWFLLDDERFNPNYVDGVKPPDGYWGRLKSWLPGTNFEVGWNALHIAAMYGCGQPLFCRILRMIHNVNQRNEDLNFPTALHIAVCFKHSTIVRLLLSDDRVDYNFENYYGITPLQLAQRLGRPICEDILNTHMLKQSTVKQPGAPKLKHKYNLRF